MLHGFCIDFWLTDSMEFIGRGFFFVNDRLKYNTFQYGNIRTFSIAYLNFISIEERRNQNAYNIFNCKSDDKNYVHTFYNA